METKSPFRLLLETEGFDSQASFELPSPRLIENSQAPTPELFYVDLEERESRTELGPLYTQSPNSTLPAFEPLPPQQSFLTPPAASRATPLSLQTHLESVHIRLRKRSTPLSQLLSRTTKADTLSLRKGRDPVKSEAHSAVVPVGKKQLTPVTKSKLSAVRTSEPRKPMWSPLRESPGRVTRVFAAPMKSYELRVKQKRVRGPELRTEPIKLIAKLSEKPKRKLK